MSVKSFEYLQEEIFHDAAIEKLNEEAFGPGRFSRAAHLIREGGGHDLKHSMVVMYDGALIASNRMTDIRIGVMKAWLLGAVVVRPDFKSAGIGKELIMRALSDVKNTDAELIILVGDALYYQRFGFQLMPISSARRMLPAPADPTRFLGFEFVEGALQRVTGRVRNAKGIIMRNSNT